MMRHTVIRSFRKFCPRSTFCVRQKGSQSEKKGDAAAESPLRRLLDEASTYGEPATTATDPEMRWATQPYASRPSEDVKEPRVVPRETTVLLFPGQGSQQVGMGRSLMQIPAARDLYQLASSVVGWDVARVCIEGPKEELTRRCQTAVFVTALAALERVRDQRPSALERVRAVAGFSLGEITALVFAGALTFEGALRLVELRAAAMTAASTERPGGMLTIWFGADAKLSPAMYDAREYAIEKGVPNPVCQVANYLFPSCKVVAGDMAALNYLEKHGSEYGIKRAARVRVEGAFHTPLMARAEAAVAEAMRALDVREPTVRVLSCVDAHPYGNVADVRRRVARLTTRAVRWEQTLHALYARPRGETFPLTLALGPGAALRSTLRQVNAPAWDSSVQIEV